MLSNKIHTHMLPGSDSVKCARKAIQ